ncbi:hypothetical protein MKW92_033486 [Papaver armeniacum]|nr:hypothetical protein MKW92_033486 [Papaver armeniacum]
MIPSIVNLVLEPKHMNMCNEVVFVGILHIVLIVILIFTRLCFLILQHTCSKSRKHMPPWPEISEIVARFERKGFKLVAIKLVVPSKDFAQKHYHDLKERPFLNGLCGFSVLSLCLPW